MMLNERFDVVKDGSITSVPGFQAGAAYCGLKTYGIAKLDLGLLRADVPCAAAAVFTQNRMRGAPVQLDEQKLAASPYAQGLIVNSGLSNSGTGAQGSQVAGRMVELTAARLGLSPELVLVMSTGKIGVQIPIAKVETGLQQIVLSADGGHDLARAIMTTDTHPKEVALRFPLGRGSSGGATMAGMAKGAGMIHPNMATMLACIVSDAAVDPYFLRQAVRKAADRSFNMVTIDGDTSTNDTFLVLANGLAGNEPVRRGTVAARRFQEALDAVAIHLAKQMARDGEGATRLIEVTVRGAVSVADARLAARQVVMSNLTKCAIHGADPNWGRIACAAGQSGALLDQNKLEIAVGSVTLMRQGSPLPFDAQAARAELSKDPVYITLDFHVGLSEATAWGCDLSEEYVTFNSEYTT